MRAFLGSILEFVAAVLYVLLTMLEGVTYLCIGARAFCLGVAEQLLPVRIPQVSRDRAARAGRKAAEVVVDQAKQFGTRRQFGVGEHPSSFRTEEWPEPAPMRITEVREPR